MKKFRKKGQLFIEYIIVLPLMLISLWLILQLIVYVYANNQIDQAADSATALVAQELRGTTGSISLLSNKDQIINDVYNHLDKSVTNNAFILFSKQENGDPRTIDAYLPALTDETTCKDAINDQNKKQVLCVLTKSIVSNGRSQEQIVVRVKTTFQVIGNFIPGLEGNIFLYGNGAATKDISGRFQYY